jgi:glutamyl-tRNA synthetase
MVSEKYIRAYALKNAVEHNGKSASGAVIAGLFNHGLKKNKIKEEMPKIQKVLDEINKLSIEEQKILFEKYTELIGHRHEREGLPELPDAKKGKVISRFAPSPSGALTLGHVLTIGPNFLYAKKYGGKFYVRIEDTNPDNIYKPAYKMIEKESRWLCDNNVEIIIQSERMDLYYKYAEELIGKGAAYVCECDKEDFKKLILEKKACPCRGLDKKEQMKRWEKMLDNKGYEVGEAVLRFKSDIKNKNPAMRDFPLARININKHPLQGNKYRVWPLMNLGVVTDDIELEITHVIRGKDHRDNAERQKMMYKVLGKEKSFPWVDFIGRLHFKDLEMSSSKMRKDIEEGKYSGWDDERLPTVASMKKRKYKQESFWKFVEQRGINEVDKTIDKRDFFEVLDKLNREAEG